MLSASWELPTEPRSGADLTRTKNSTSNWNLLISVNDNYTKGILRTPDNRRLWVKYLHGSHFLNSATKIIEEALKISTDIQIITNIHDLADAIANPDICGWKYRLKVRQIALS